MIKYGLISETDARVIEKTIDLICESFPDEMLRTCEIGLYSGETSKGILQYIFNEKKRYTWHTGIDNNKDNEPLINYPENATLIIGNSTEVYNQLEDNSQHFIFIDGCHSFPSVIADFFCYAPKVNKGGYVAFHDTGKHIKPFKDYQGMGSKDDPDMYISVRKALLGIGLLGTGFAIDIEEFEDSATVDQVIDLYNKTGISPQRATPFGRKFIGWELIFDEADETNEAGGVCVFKKLY